MIKIFTIGDSLTAGYPGNDPNSNSNPESTYQYWLEKTLNNYHQFKNSRVFNFGVPGITSKQIYDRLVRLSNDKFFIDSQIVIVNGGENDWTAYERIDDTDLMKNLIECCNYCLKMVKRWYFQVWLLSVDTVMEQVGEIGDKLVDFINQKNSKNLFFFDWFRTVFDPETNKVKETYDSGDNEHLNIEGYKLIGMCLASLIIEKRII